jgi:cytochrome b subunit of formate dehydrogenase
VDFSKLYRPSALNSFQFIALTGLLMSAGAHLILHFFVGRMPVGFNWLYVCWTGFYIVGTLINYFGKPDDPHHHHHH